MSRQIWQSNGGPVDSIADTCFISGFNNVEGR